MWSMVFSEVISWSLKIPTFMCAHARGDQGGHNFLAPAIDHFLIIGTSSIT